MKLWTLATLSTALLLILSGCGAKATPKKEAPVDDTLPVVTLTKNGTIVDVNSIALEWQAVSDPRVEGVYIYRAELDGANKKDGADEYYDTVSNRFSTHYLDTNIKPNSRYSYYFKTFSANAESRKSQATTITSLPPMESVAWIHAVTGMPRSAKVLWRPHANEKVKAYIVQRKTLENDKWEDVATVYGRLNAEYIDKDLKDKFTYTYRVRTLTHDNLISNPSQEITIVTKSLPKEVMQITASTTLPKKIKLSWDYSAADDFLTFRVYRSVSVNGTYSMLADTKEMSYVDSIDEDGKEYFYRVSVFDKDKLESITAHNSVMGKTLVKPSAPSISEAKIVDGRVKLSWISLDSRVKNFVVQKKHKKSIFESKVTEIENIKSNEFFDSDIQNGESYLYRVFSVDANGIKSEPSIEVQMKIQDVMVNKASVPLDVNRAVLQQPKVTEDVKVNEPVVEEVIVPLQDFN